MRIGREAWQFQAKNWQNDAGTRGACADRFRLVSIIERTSAMLIAHVTFAVDEIHREHVLNRLAKDATTVRSMNGCVAFIPFADPTDPQKIGVLHEWRSS